ncbi:BRCT domain-containing protein At4g02110 [Cornus florida]|uniref:BRCT domain-containing protein At4g02110 n=1 Tax=Cornus florida TaxID=4283 RepID=UPI0028A1DCE2|nr:BRCT domain-containing protein At4g02110 [Cornus florida]
MLETRPDSSPFDHPSQTFAGVRFVLLGFDPIDDNKVRFKLVNGGGIDVGQYNPNCTHVIVDKLVYDDPICVAARRDEKTLVTALWVDHSFDIGMPVDPTAILYQPVRDLNGIPGAKSLIVCLTGYQRQCRDDIMTMVGLMGAHFSKPLVANTVTHLICYKFEGEKYELAKKIKRIKLVNHRWLEDCLNAWEIVPEDSYDKSGYELEMMEAEAKDSEEEAEDSQDIAKKLRRENQINASPPNLQIGMSRANQSPVLKGEGSRNLLNTSASKSLSNVDNTNDMVLATGKTITSDQAAALNEPHDRTPVSAKAGFDLPCTSGSAKKSPPSDVAKLSAISYSRKTIRSTTLPMYSGEMESNLSSLPKINMEKSNVMDGFDLSSSKAEQDKDGSGTDFRRVRTTLKGTGLTYEEGKIGTLPEKRKLDVSCVTSKLQKTRHSPEAFISKGLHVSDGAEVSEPASLLDGPFEVSNHLSPGSNAHYMDGTAAPSFSNSSVNLSTPKTSSYTRSSLPHDMPISKIDISEIRQGSNVVEASRVSFAGLKRTSLAGKPETTDVTSKVEHAMNEVWGPQNELQDIEVPSARTKSLEIEKSNSPANLDLRKGVNSDSLSKPLRRKTVAKKNLGSRPKLGTGNSTNEKGPIYLNQTASQMDAVTCSSGGEKTAGRKEFVNSEKVETVTPNVTVGTATGTGTNNVSKPDNEANTISMDDETEAPEEKDDHQLEASVNEEKSGKVEPAHMVDIVMGEKSGEDLVTNQTKRKVLGLHDCAMTSDENESGTGFEKAVCAQRIKLGESTRKDSAVKGKIIKGKKHPSSKTKKKSLPTATEIRSSNERINRDNANNEKSKEKIEIKKEKIIPYPARKTKKSLPVFRSDNSVEVEKEKEKENRPIDIGGQNVSHGEQQDGKLASKSNRTPMKIDLKSGQTCRERVPKVKVEPVWFILSGHRLQRKEFQQVIRRLKGRVCRDSHQWSYQATHFIVPDPIKRTEKFFAAAASGRWILKTDYLTASSQAGRFLVEEPYEWHQNSLSEDGSINLEAPRKWRLLREKTGHGAFHGMRIIIYGECIAPPLDTLKRVVKAGDGAILATSPPYTRYLKSGVDFAIVSPGMPRVDMWVQEFLQHEIPCVVADYLVEYVCKPGYSLERHVQYNTHTWAERSFANMLSRSEEIVEEQTPPEDDGINDVPCQVCGSRDRGEVMLICGDESGGVGCGVGMHIDCCDPPLEEVPEEEWFCPKCSNNRKSVNVCAGKSIKKKTRRK